MNTTATKTPTLEIATAFQAAFDHFNAELFGGELPTCLICVARKRGAAGYFWADVFRDRQAGDAKLDEIAMNPDHFDRTLAVIMSTLVHEMAHHWQKHFGKPGKGRYHNAQWVEKMLELGLQPVSANGKGTGNSVSHDIVDDGPFEKSFNRMTDVRLDWGSLKQKRTKAKQTRKKLVCPDCGQSIWGTAKNEIKCATCDIEMEAQEE